MDKTRTEQFCCSGCRAVWEILNTCNLAEYYRLRSEFADTPAKPARISGKSFAYLDDPEFLRRFGEPRTAGGWRVRFYLEGVHCVACGWLVEKILLEHERVRFANLDLGRSLLEVVFSPAEISLSRIAQTLDRIGYTPHPLTDSAGTSELRKETRRLLARMGIAAAGAANIMLLAVSQYAGDFTGIEAGYSALFRWVSLGLALPAVTYSAYPFYRGAWNGLRRGVLHMDLPISLGIVASFAISFAATIANRGEVYFDSVSMLIFLLLAGRLLLQRANRWAADASESLLALAPKTARRVSNGSWEEVLLSDVVIGDRLQVVPGATVPVDGILESEVAWLRESHLTGEPAAVEKRAGETLYAGSVAETTDFVMKAVAVGETTRLGRLAQLVREASARRAPIIGFLDRIAGYFVAGLLVLSGVTALVWYFVEPSRILWNVAALMVVACPCALGLAAPVAFAVAIGRAAKQGVFIKGQDAVERLSRVQHVILDKTGTLTEGRLTLRATYFAESLDPDVRAELIRGIATIVRSSGHVLAAAFSVVPASAGLVERLRVFPGAGVEGYLDKIHYAVGSKSFVSERVTRLPNELEEAEKSEVKSGRTLMWVAQNGVPVALLALGDRLHESSRDAVFRLKKLRLEVELLSGDHPEAVASVARELDLSAFEGGVSPEAKLARVDALESKGTMVAMVGDGINDAAALSRASVGISAAGAAEVARDAADVFISAAQSPAAIVQAIQLSRRAMKSVRRTLVVAVAYNLLGATLAVTGNVSPLAAAILMPLSSVTVLLIATRG